MTDTEGALREALVRLSAAADTLLNVDPHNLLDKRPCPTCDTLRGALKEARAALARAEGEPQKPLTERAEEYLRTLTWGRNAADRTIALTVETHLRYFARWVNFPVDAPAPAARPEGPTS